MVNIPGGLYTENVFSINTTPAANMYAKLMAQQEAKRATLDKYFSTLADKATDTGMRADKEGLAFRQAVQNYKDFYVNNKEALTSGRRPDLEIEATRLAKLPSQIAAESREALNTAKTAAQVSASNPDAFARWTDETTGIDKSTGQAKVDEYGNPTGLNAHNQPIYTIDANGQVVRNPKFKHFDLSQVQVNPQEVDLAKEWEESSKGVPKSSFESYEPGTEAFTKTKVTTTEIAPEGYQQIASKANARWNRGVEFTMHKQMPLEKYSTPEGQKELEDLNVYFKKAYPDKEISSDKDLFVANAIKMADATGVKKEKEFDRVAYDAFRDKEREKADKRMEIFKKSLSKEDQINIADVKTPLDLIPDGSYKTTRNKDVYRKNGQWVNADGTPYTSTKDDQVRIIGNQIPIGVKNAYPTGTKPLIVQYLDLDVKNGTTESAANPFMGFMSRNDLLQEELKKAGVKSTINQIVPKKSTEKITIKTPLGKATTNLGF
jgi:hypothetical protein